jgi:hypothetical protein
MGPRNEPWHVPVFHKGWYYQEIFSSFNFFLHAIIITQLLSTDVRIVYDVMKYVLDDLDSDFSLNINYYFSGK